MSFELSRSIDPASDDPRLQQVHEISNGFVKTTKDAVFNPSDPLNVFERRRRIASANGTKTDSREDLSNRDVALNGITTFAEVEFGSVMTDHLAGIIESEMSLGYVGLTDEEKMDPAWGVVVNTYADAEVDANSAEERYGDMWGDSDETVEHLGEEDERWISLRDAFDQGVLSGLRKVLSGLSSDIPLHVYRRDIIDMIDNPDYVDGGTIYTLPTKISGVCVVYFYPDDDPSPSISLKVEPAKSN